MSKTLKISADLSLPLEAVTEKLAFLGRTGTGKTYAAMKLAELMLEAGAQVVALDFVGKWYGLRVAGAGEPFLIPVFGGLHGDYPLESTGGKLMADLLVDRSISAVIDVSQFTRGEQVRFCLDFATQFFQRKKASPTAVHLFLEECQEVLPQNAQPNESQMLGAFERIWKLGRNFGIGGSLITQRPQEVNKKALNMSGTLFVFQMTGPQERKTAEQWVSAQGINEDIGDLLPRLAKGRPHVWSVAFEPAISKTVQIAEKRTADVSATPSVSAGTRKERPLTPIDAKELAQAMAATVERAKADDPKALRARVLELERELKKKAVEILPTVRNSTDGIQKPVGILTDADRELLKQLRDEYLMFSESIGEKADLMLTSLADRAKAAIDDALKAWTDNIDRRRELFAKRLEGARVQRLIGKLEQAQVNAPQVARMASQPNPKAVAIRQPNRPAPAVASGDVDEPGRRILGALAWLLAAGIEHPTRHQVAFLARYTVNGHFNNTLGNLRTSGHVDYPGGGLVALTDAGRAAVDIPESAPDRQAMVDQVLAVLRDEPARRLFTLIAQAQGPIAREDLASQAGYTVNGHFNNTLGNLRTLGVIDYPQRGTAALSRSMFEGLS